MGQLPTQPQASFKTGWCDFGIVDVFHPCTLLMVLSHLFSSALLVIVVVLLIDTPSISASRDHHVMPRVRHQQLAHRQPRAVGGPAPPRRLRRRQSCKLPPTTNNSNSTSASPVESSSTIQDTSPTAPSSNANGVTGGNSGGDSGGGQPSDWPTVTQPGAVPTATRTSPADPYLRSLSQALDNSKNPPFTDVHKGQMTYYDQGLGACGDTYDDQSFTAAVSQLLYDNWPGATGAQNRNPICGPFVPGRRILDASGTFKTVVPGKDYAIVGGDGLINCDPDPSVQCHIPLTATVKHGGKQIQVKIVDRCVGCKKDDIDLTPAAFQAIADMGLGRTDVEWQFDQY